MARCRRVLRKFRRLPVPPYYGPPPTRYVMSDTFNRGGGVRPSDALFCTEAWARADGLLQFAFGARAEAGRQPPLLPPATPTRYVMLATTLRIIKSSGWRPLPCCSCHPYTLPWLSLLPHPLHVHPSHRCVMLAMIWLWRRNSHSKPLPSCSRTRCQTVA